jgi:hypothetical protein
LQKELLTGFKIRNADSDVIEHSFSRLSGDAARGTRSELTGGTARSRITPRAGRPGLAESLALGIRLETRSFHPALSEKSARRLDLGVSNVADL